MAEKMLPAPVIEAEFVSLLIQGGMPADEANEHATHLSRTQDGWELKAASGDRVVSATVRTEQLTMGLAMFSAAVLQPLATKLLSPEAVDHPRHYNTHPAGIECIDVVEHMGFNLGNAVKYIWRADEKGAALQDLEKARWYVDREIEKRKREAA